MDGMWKDRQEAKVTRQEAKAAGLIQEDAEDGPPPNAEQQLEEIVANDPYIQVALFLLKEGQGGSSTVGAAH